TSSGAIMPGKMTISERPRIGRTWGSEWAETRAGASGFTPARTMVIDSVSGEVIVASFYILDAAALKRFRNSLIPLGDGHLGALHLRLSERHVNAQKAIQVGCFRLDEVVPGRNFEQTFKRSVVDFHYEEAGFRRTAAIRSMATNAQAVSLYGNFQIITPHPGQLHFDHQPVVRFVSIGIRNPLRFGITAA